MNEGSTRLQNNITDVDDVLSLIENINERALLQAQLESQRQTIRSVNPVPRDLLKALPKYFVLKTKDLSANNIQPCSVCLENYKCRQHSQELPCGHVFHKVCIHKWFTKYNRTCPVCRKDPFMAES